MKNYELYEVEDFVMDEYFRRWVKQPDRENNLFWQSWLRDNPHKRKLIEEAKQIVEQIQFEDTLSTEEKEQLWSKVESYIAQEAGETPVRSMTGTSHKAWHQKYSFRVAAAIAILLLCSAVFFFIRQNQVQQYTTNYGEIKTVMLPDGSTVVLNANSSLKFSNEWDELNREVWLEGEAFFSVLPKQATLSNNPVKAKFSVYTKDIRVEVLGTKFNVSQRKNAAKVVLNSGKVKLNITDQTRAGQDILMKPGEMIELSVGEEKVTKKTVNPELYTSWRNKKWILENATLSEVAVMIEETYGIPVRVTDKGLANKKITGTLPTAHLNNLLEALSATLDVRIVQTSEEIQFIPNNLP